MLLVKVPNDHFIDLFLEYLETNPFNPNALFNTDFRSRRHRH